MRSAIVIVTGELRCEVVIKHFTIDATRSPASHKTSFAFNSADDEAQPALAAAVAGAGVL